MNDDLGISVQDVSVMLGHDSAVPCLIDVRRPDEFATVAIDGAVNIPLDVLPDRLGEIARDRNVITICHHGVRSRQAAAFLSMNGFSARSMVGGVDAWATQIDPTLPRY